MNYKNKLKQFIIKSIYIFFFLLSKLPLHTLYCISRFIKLLNFSIIKYRIKIVENNIKKSFPNLNKQHKIKILNKFYSFFFDLIFEIIKSISLTEKAIIKNVKIINPSIINKTRKQNKSIILLGSHYSNWEWLFLRISVMQDTQPYAIYKPLSNKYINDILLTIRTKFGGQLISIDKWKKFLLKNKKNSHVLMFISDQVPEKKQIGEKINFLNQETLFHKGAAKTAKLLNADVFYMEMIKIKKSYYSLEFKKLNRKEITKEYAKLLEQTINNQPEYWLWSHNRWKR